MFDEILQLVKEHLGNNPQVAGAVPQDQQDAVHREVAGHINDQLQNQASSQGGVAGLLSQFQGGSGQGNLASNAISGGLIGSLANKFGLSPAVTGAIAAALPSILQKFGQQFAGNAGSVNALFNRQ